MSPELYRAIRERHMRSGGIYRSVPHPGTDGSAGSYREVEYTPPLCAVPVPPWLHAGARLRFGESELEVLETSPTMCLVRQGDFTYGAETEILTRYWSPAETTTAHPGEAPEL